MEIENEYRVVDLKSEDFMGVTSYDGVKVTVGTRAIAEKFNKRHDDLISMVERRLKSIELIGESQTDIFALNFIESSYKSRGKTFKEYQLTKDGFIFVVMGLEKNCYKKDIWLKLKEKYKNFQIKINYAGLNNSAFFV
jgi:Rha family phage regulatory protein